MPYLFTQCFLYDFEQQEIRQNEAAMTTKSETPIPALIQRGLPNAVTYDLSSPECVIISLPSTSTWSSGLHWHETHTEYLKVIKGSIIVRLGHVQHTVSATGDDQPEVRVDRYVRHEWHRAEAEGEEVVVAERTDPADGEKALFFWNLNGVILKAPRMLEPGQLLSILPTAVAHVMLGLWVELQLVVVFAHLDNLPVLVNLSDSMIRKWHPATLHWLIATDQVLSKMILAVAASVGRLLRIEPVAREHTPSREFAEWKSQSRGKVEK